MRFASLFTFFLRVLPSSLALFSVIIVLSLDCTFYLFIMHHTHHHTHAHVPSLHTTITYITSMISIHRERHPSNFIRALLYSLLSSHVHFFLRFFLYFSRSRFINIISRPFLLHVHYRLNLSLVSFVCLCLSCLSLCHAHLTSTATHKPSHTAAQYNFFTFCTQPHL